MIEFNINMQSTVIFPFGYPNWQFVILLYFVVHAVNLFKRI